MTRIIQKFHTLSLQEKFWILITLVLLCMFRLGLKFVPLKTIFFLSGMTKTTRDCSFVVDHRDLTLGHRIGHVVASVAAHIPWGSPCLVQALCTALILKFYNIPCILCIGTCHNEESLDGHAWIKVATEPVIGGDGIESFNLLAQFVSTNNLHPAHEIT